MVNLPWQIVNIFKVFFDHPSPCPLRVAVQPGPVCNRPAGRSRGRYAIQPFASSHERCNEKASVT